MFQSMLLDYCAANQGKSSGNSQKLKLVSRQIETLRTRQLAENTMSFGSRYIFVM